MRRTAAERTLAYVLHWTGNGYRAVCKCCFMDCEGWSTTPALALDAIKRTGCRSIKTREAALIDRERIGDEGG